VQFGTDGFLIGIAGQSDGEDDVQLMEAPSKPFSKVFRSPSDRPHSTFSQQSTVGYSAMRVPLSYVARGLIVL
jgi:hypothetical protein